MTQFSFEAYEYDAETRFTSTRLSFEGATDQGWTIRRNGQEWLRLGAGYVPLETHSCGVCSTDLARHFLPFPLPQVTGHELVARDAEGRRVVVEINASHRARGVQDDCPFCSRGLETHCPERLVLGIHDLPGGFGPRFLAPRHSIHAIPDAVPDEVAVLVEPFAAALHAVHRSPPAMGQRVGVLGPRRLGLLLVAALAADRKARGMDYEILALSRHESLNAKALEFGADRSVLIRGEEKDLPEDLVDILFDTTGNPDAFATASRIAAREIHVKSTHGQPCGGFGHLTELVVDEIGLARFHPEEDLRPHALEGPTRIAWASTRPVPTSWGETVELHLTQDPAALLERLEAASDGRLPRVDLAIVDDLAMADAFLRPDPDHERSPVRPRGWILFHPEAIPSGFLQEVLVTKDLRLSSSRCGDFGVALDLLARDEQLRERCASLVTHRFSAARLPEAFEMARTPDCIKAVILQSEEGS